MFSTRAFANVLVTGASCAPRLRQGLTNYAKAILTLDRAPHDTTLTINVVSLDSMAAINAQWCGKRGPTDVLTFTQGGASADLVSDLLFGGDSYGSSEKNDLEMHCEPREDHVDLGEIFICVPYMWARCCAQPTKTLPFSPYMVAALVHAQLHAMGYDHETPEDLRAMVRREQRLGRQLRALARRYPTLLPPLDGLEYLRATMVGSTSRNDQHRGWGL